MAHEIANLKWLDFDNPEIECKCGEDGLSEAGYARHLTEAQQIHIEGLQVTLRNRNRRIEQLEQQVAEGGASREALDNAFSRGVIVAAGRIRNALASIEKDG